MKVGYDFVDVRDVADGVLRALRWGRSCECYILSNQFYHVSELLEMLHEITGKRRVWLNLPLWFVKGTAGLSELYYKLRKQPPLFTSYSIYTLRTHAVFSHEKADAVLGYTVRDMKATLKDTVAWLKEIMKLKGVSMKSIWKLHADFFRLILSGFRISTYPMNTVQT